MNFDIFLVSFLVYKLSNNSIFNNSHSLWHLTSLSSNQL